MAHPTALTDVTEGMPKALLLTVALFVGACTGSDAPPAAGAAAIGDAHFTMDDGYRLPYDRWGPDDPQAVVLGLHGLNDYRTGLALAAEHLAADGIATYAYDQRSFGATEGKGRWPGTDALINDAEAVSELLAGRYPDRPLYLLGQSMGGGVTMILAAERGLDAADGIVLVAPAVWGRRHMPWYQRYALWLTANLTPWWRFTGESLGVRPTDNIEVMRQLANDPLIQRETRADTLHGVTNLMDRALNASNGITLPALILYGENDQVIPPRPTCGMLRRLPGPPDGQWRLAVYPEGYHMLTRDLQRERVNADIAAWILDPATPRLPSGLESDRDAALATLCPNRRSTLW